MSQKGKDNPYRLSPTMVSAIVGCIHRQTDKPEMILKQDLPNTSVASLRKKGLVHRHKTPDGRWALTDMGEQEYRRLVHFLEEDEHL